MTKPTSQGKWIKDDIETWKDRLEDWDGTQKHAKQIWGQIFRDCLSWVDHYVVTDKKQADDNRS